MRIMEFLQQLEDIFPIGVAEEKKNKRFSLYIDVIEGEIQKNGKEYNLLKVLHYLIKTHQYKSFPAIADIIKALPIGEITQYQQCKNDGDLLVVTLPNGYKYEFTVSAIGKSIKELKNSIQRKYGTCEYSFYPKKTVIIGDKVFYPE